MHVPPSPRRPQPPGARCSRRPGRRAPSPTGRSPDPARATTGAGARLRGERARGRWVGHARDAPGSSASPPPDGADWPCGISATGPTVVLAHCWAASHAVWIPVARRLVESGHRVVLYDQRGHGASSRGTAPLEHRDAGRRSGRASSGPRRHRRRPGRSLHGGHDRHGPGHVPARGPGQRARAIVLVATAAADMGWRLPQSDRFAARLMGSPSVSRAHALGRRSSLRTRACSASIPCGPHGPHPHVVRRLRPAVYAPVTSSP